MPVALVWSLVLVLAAGWSLMVWLLHAAAAWAVSGAGALGAAATGGLRLPDAWQGWLPPAWVDAAQALLATLEPFVQSLLQSAPSLAGVLGIAAWVVWGLGAGLLLVAGAVAHTLIAVWRRRARPGDAAVPLAKARRMA